MFRPVIEWGRSTTDVCVQTIFRSQWKTTGMSFRLLLRYKMKKFFLAIVKAIAAFFIVTIGLVVVYKFIPPPFTPLMVQRKVEAVFSNSEHAAVHYDWVGYDDISPSVFQAVIAAEDKKFVNHSGFDWDSIERAMKYNERKQGKKVRGASTISQQVAKNVFLWPGRDWVRKGLEAYFTVLIEFIWGKQRILEVYANVVEQGDDGGNLIFGVGASADYFFGTTADKISRSQAALIAAVLPSPRRFSIAKPSAYVSKRRSFISGQMGGIGTGYLKKVESK